MTAKEYLQQYLDADREINAKLEEISRLRAMATATTQTLSADRVQSSPENKIERICGKIADMEAEVDTEIDRLIEIKKRVKTAIRVVPDASQRAVLERRYILGERWEEIAVDLHYTYRHVTRLHGRALRYMAQDVLECPILR